MKGILQLIFNVSILVFVVGSMLGMGLSLTVKQIVEPLKNVRLVVYSILANFIVIPAFVYAMLLVLPVSEGESIGLILLSLSAGAPFLPKLAEIAKGNIPFSIGLMLLLMVITIFFLPLVLPLLLSGASVSSWAIAKSLIVMMLLPLIIALWIRAKFESLAGRVQPIFTQLTNIALLLITVTLLILHFQSMIDLIGPGIIGIILLLLASLIFGYLMGGPSAATRSVLALGTAQRNISAAILVAAQNFTDPKITLTLIVTSIIGLLIMLPFAKWQSKKAA
jgi:BASS family bile acid:Na+ symporter